MIARKQYENYRRCDTFTESIVTLLEVVYNSDWQ